MAKKGEGKRVAIFVFGVVFVTAILALAIFFPNPTGFQYTVFRIVLAVAVAGVAAFIPGLLHVQISTWLRASGALAIFVIVYFYSPAELVQQPPVPPKGEEVTVSTESLSGAGPLGAPREAAFTDPDESSSLEIPATDTNVYSLKFTLWNRSPYERMRISSVQSEVIATADQINFCCPETRSLFDVDVSLTGLQRQDEAWPVTVEIPPLSSHAFDARVRLVPGNPDRVPLVWLGLVARYSGPDGQQRSVRSDKVYLLNSTREQGAYDLAALRRLVRARPDFARWFMVDRAIAWLRASSPGRASAQ